MMAAINRDADTGSDASRAPLPVVHRSLRSRVSDAAFRFTTCRTAHAMTPYRVARAAALALGLLVLAATTARAETRVALVIANSGYTTGPLANTRADGELMTRTLRGLGFEVTRVLDTDLKTLRRAILEFGRRLRAEDGVGLFYYAGHGVQVEGENYIVPVGADIKDEKEVPLEGVAFSELLRAMERSKSRINIAIFDACRDNPFQSASRGLTRGLVGIDAPTGTIVAYATAPGHVAFDGDGGPNSPFTAALAAEMQGAGLPIEDVFKRTRRAVLAATGGRQTPWESSSLTGDFYFKPKTTVPEASGRADGQGDPVEVARLEELRAWEAVKTQGARADYERYLAQYPNGIFGELARLRLAGDKPKPGPWPWSAQTTGVETGSAANGQPGNADTTYARAVTLDTPAATPQQLAEAMQLYNTAADLGLPAAMHALARMHDRGRGTPRDLAKAAAHYRRAADLGYPPSMASLGTMLEFGEGGATNQVEALSLYRRAAELGDAGGMTSLAYLYVAGKGVNRDYVEARRWYKAAADAGQSRAMFNLALMNIRGEGAAPDFAEAVHWLSVATEKGHTGAMRELAFLFDEGRGVTRDPVRAANYLLAAFKQGNKNARDDLYGRSGAWSLATRREVQQALARQELYRGRISGVIDGATRKALDAFAGAGKAG